MSDIFREVEEDVRRERIERLWKAYGNYAIAALALLFLGIGAWQLWQRHEQQERLKVADTFIADQRISNPGSAASSFADLAQTAPKGYATIARLEQAGAMLASGQRDNAIDLYKQIAKDDNGQIGAVARLRAAWALADTETRANLAEFLKPLEQPGNAWRENAEEVMAYADYRALDTKSALARYTILSLDPQAPDALRARAKAMAAFLRSGGAISYGTVQADVVPTPPAPGASAPAAAPAPATAKPAH